MTAKENLIEFPAPTAPVFQTGDGKWVVNCKSLRVVGTNRWLDVTVPIEGKFMPKGTDVMVHSVGIDASGQQEIPGTQFFEEYRVTGQEAGGHFEVQVPYEPFIKKIQPPQNSGLRSGHVRIWYAFKINGNPIKSHEFFHEVRLLDSTGRYCEGTPT